VGLLCFFGCYTPDLSLLSEVDSRVWGSFLVPVGLFAIFILIARKGEREMEGIFVQVAVFTISLVCSMGAFLPVVQAKSQGPPAPPSSRGSTIDQGIACAMLFLALVLTYFVHPIDSMPHALF
jgi:hypothetical protein